MRAVGRIETVRSSAGTTVVALVGDHDMSTAPELRTVLAKAIADVPGIVVDLSETTFLDSSILHALIEADVALQSTSGSNDSGRRIVLQFGGAAGIRHVFEVAGVLERFEHLDA